MINLVVLSIPVYFLLIGIELLIQQSTRKQIYRLNDAVTNISCGITQQITGVFLKVLSVGVYFLIYEHLRLFTIPDTIISWILLLFAVDLCYYWAHRMSHEINLFWGGHVVHHQSEDYNLSVALRQGTFQVVWTFMFYLPLALIGFNPVTFVLVSAIVTVYQFWIHTETIGRLGFLEKFMNTPSHHRVHHGRDPKYIDKNHAGMFIIWDKLFGTFQEEEEKPTYGITKPVQSWNPVWVNIEHYNTMWLELQKIKGFKNKLKYILFKPGWLPDEMGGYQPAPPVPQDYKKWDVKAHEIINYYVLLQYLLVLLGTALFLFNIENLGIAEKLIITAAIIFTILNDGALFEQKSWVFYLESFRILLFSIIAAYIVLPIGNYYLIPVAVYFIISTGWLFYSFQISKTSSAH